MKMHIKILACRQGLGSATVSVAVGRVPRPTSSPIPSPAFFFGLAAYLEKARRNVFGGTPNTASGTHALPEITFARSDPLKKSKYQTLFPLALTVAALALNLSAVPQAQAGSFLTNTPMLTARAEHTATLLRNGKVLVAGGDTAGSAELYDPATGTWAATGAMSNGRISHTATLLADGRVLVVGGLGYLKGRPEIYDPATGKWAETAAPHASSTLATATLLPNGKVLVYWAAWNGVDPSTAEIFDPASGTWTPIGAPGTAFSQRPITATLLRNGQVLLAGASGKIGLSSTSDIYNPVAGSWTTITNSIPMSSTMLHTATLLNNSKVLFVGRASPLSGAQIYDPDGTTWSQAGASLIQGREYPTATPLLDGTVLVVGGAVFGPGGEVFSSAEVFNPASRKWTLLASHLATKRFGHTATLLHNGKVLIAGGLSDHIGALSSTELFDPGETMPVP